MEIVLLIVLVYIVLSILEKRSEHTEHVTKESRDYPKVSYIKPGSTPKELAKALGVSDKTLRAWLRKTYPRHSVQKGDWWYLTEDQIRAAKIKFKYSKGRKRRIVGSRRKVKPLGDPKSNLDPISYTKYVACPVCGNQRMYRKNMGTCCE